MGIHHVDHFELVVSDLDRALEFYRNLGLETAEITTPQGRRRAFLNIGDSQQINVVTPADVENLRRKALPGGGHFCMVWEGNADEAVAHLTSRGFTPDRGPGRGQGTLGEGTSIFVYDPDRNSVEILIYPVPAMSGTPSAG